MTEGQKRNAAARTWWDSLTTKQKKRAACLKQKKYAPLLEIKFNELPIDRRYEIISHYQNFVK